MAKDHLANAGGMGSVSGLERSHVPQSNRACAPQPRALESQLLKPMSTKPVLCNERSHCNKKPMHCNKRKSMSSNEESAQPKRRINK